MWCAPFERELCNNIRRFHVPLVCTHAQAVGGSWMAIFADGVQAPIPKYNPPKKIEKNEKAATAQPLQPDMFVKISGLTTPSLKIVVR